MPSRPHKIIRRRNNRPLFVCLGISLIFIFVPFLSVHQNFVLFSLLSCKSVDHTPTMHWTEKYAYLNPEYINEILRILETTPNLWGYRGHEQARNDTIASRINAQKEWIQQLGQTNFIKNIKRKKKILVYVEPNAGDHYFFTGNKIKCPYYPEFQEKCDLILENRSWRDLIKNHPSQNYYKDLQIDAVIGVRNGYWDLDKWYSEPTLPPDVHQIYYVYESPCHTGSVQVGRNSAWLSSYWRGSDIPIPYRQYVKVKKNEEARNESFPSSSVDNRKLVAALISNCKFVQNNRMGYISQLKKYIDVDVYGMCGDKKKHCPQNDCLAFLGSHYKFYLSFENCDCMDYITEKFFVNALQNDMIPVVMGGTAENYATAAPPFSFIHVDDFSSPKELANYLQLLDKNESLFRKYGEWKDVMDWNWKITAESNEDFLCRACSLLYYGDFKPPPPYSNCSVGWKDLNQCLPNDEWNWGPKTT